jgi:hypothetical protein
VARSTAEFLADRDAVECWLLDEMERLEEQEAELSHWFHSTGGGLGFVITAPRRSGEMHLFADGRVTLNVTDDGHNREVILSSETTVSDDAGFKEQFEVFRSTVLNLSA